MSGNERARARGWRRIAPFGAMAALLLSACGPGAGDATPPADNGGTSLRIGSMVWNTSIPFYSNFIQGQRDAAAELGLEIDIRDGGGELEGQVAVVQQLIAEEFDLILVSPGDAEGIVPVIQQANEAGIPVISVNSTVGDGAEVVTYVGADDYEFGQKQGELLVQAIGEEGRVGYIMGALGVSAQTLRQQGFEDYLTDYPGIEITDAQTANWDNAQALALTQDWLNRYGPGELDAIVDQGPEGVTGAQWAHDNGRDDVLFLMGDYPRDVREAIQAGTVYGTVNQDPYPQGYRAVELAQAWLEGRQDEVPQPHDYLPLPIVTQENVEEFEPAWG